MGQYDELDMYAPVESGVAVDILTPVLHEFEYKLLELLKSHGAEVTQEGLPYRTYHPEGGCRVAVNYRVHFPVGTVKQLGLMLGNTRGFTLHFPDGFELRGQEQIRTRGADKVILSIPASTLE